MLERCSESTQDGRAEESGLPRPSTVVKHLQLRSVGTILVNSEDLAVHPDAVDERRYFT